jgi:hypothetical protein
VIGWSGRSAASSVSDANSVAMTDLIALRGRVEDITRRWLQGSDRQTPSQAER